uniref:SRCR domain-containing protein n=1 Tax=Tetradesmus obliquus TaxID=3088 RepID=A0A383VAY0_TETOB|eukprot:jgi/Sobl393_1/17464/SZX62718.1
MAWPCTSEPSKFSPPLPPNSAWSCTGSTEGSTCAAGCNPGYTAAGSTSWISTCTSGIWNQPAADMLENPLICMPAPCSKTDPTDENSLVVLPSLATWVCTGKAHGDVCTATCSGGYHKHSGTSWQSTCTAGHWPAPAVSTSGDTPLVCDPHGCTGTPVDTAPDMPALSSWICPSLIHGSKCRANCNSGTTTAAGTSWVSTCNLGSWGQPEIDTGGTAKLLCQPSCYGSPSSTNMPADAVFLCSSFEHGAKCKAYCNAQFTADVSTSWVSTCVAGSWGAVVPDTGDNKLNCLASCNGNPSPDPRFGVFSCLLSKLQVDITLTETVTATAPGKRAAARGIVRPAGTGTLDKLRALILSSGLAQAMPTVMKDLQQAGIEYAEPETTASLSSAVVKEGDRPPAGGGGVQCLAGQMAYAPTGPCYRCPPWQYNPVAGGNCSNCTIPNTEPNLSLTACDCLPGFNEAKTAAGVLEKCVLASLNARLAQITMHTELRVY